MYIILIASLILLVQIKVSKRFTPNYGLIVSLIINSCIIVLLCLIELIEYDPVVNSAPLSLFLSPIILYGFISLVVHCLVYVKVKQHLRGQRFDAAYLHQKPWFYGLQSVIVFGFHQEVIQNIVTLSELKELSEKALKENRWIIHFGL